MSQPEILKHIPDVHDPEFRRERFRKIQAFLRRVFDGSPLYREKFAAVGRTPADVRTWEDFRALGFALTKADERRSQEWSLREEGHPLGMHVCAPVEEVLAATGTSGTTGMPAFSYQYTRRDLEATVELWRRAALWIGMAPGHLVFDLMGYSMGPVGAPALYAFWQLGIRAHPIPAESGAQRILYLMDLFRPDFLVCTPSLAEHLVERAPSVIGKSVGDLRVTGIMVIGEPGGGLPEFRQKIREAYGARLYDAQIGSLGICNISCDAEEYTGMHQLAPDMQVWPEDLVSLASEEPLPLEHGAVGRMLLTSFDQEARPTVKLDMGDVWQLWTEPCVCGFRGYRYSIIGRTDDMLIVKGVNVYPSALKDVIESFRPRTTGYFRILLDTPPPMVKPPLRLRIEYSGQRTEVELAALARDIRDRMHGTLKVGPDIEMVPPGTLPRAALKTNYVERQDRRS
jgi:phenylacetate-CoA ligase